MPRILPNKGVNTEENYDKSYEDNNDFDYTQQKRYELLVAKLKPNMTFIDMGCGLSPCCLMARKITKDVWASDFSKKLIEKKREKYGDMINFVYDDIRCPNLPKESFDYIVLGEVLEHLENPEIVLKYVLRTLRKGGIIAVSVPNNDMGSYAPEHHVWSFNKQELRKLLKQFGDVEIKNLNETHHDYLIAYLWKK